MVAIKEENWQCENLIEILDSIQLVFVFLIPFIHSKVL
jgi:hypothetical protein